MKELIYNNLTNGNEIFGIILAVLYFVIPVVVAGFAIVGVIKLVEYIKDYRTIKAFEKDRALYEFAQRKYR
jgi:hypothetical protein